MSRLLAETTTDAIESITSASENIADPDVFGTYRSYLKYSSDVDGPVMSKVLDSLISGLQSEHEATARDSGDTESYSSHRIYLEMYAFLLSWATWAVDRAKADSGDNEQPASKRKGRGAKAAAPKKTKKTQGTTQTFSSIDHIPNLLSTISKVLTKLASQRMWPTTVDRDIFIKCVASCIPLVLL